VAESMSEDKNPIRRIVDELGQVGATFLLVWLLAAFVALFVLALFV
jgi:hypothetical protein